MSNSCKHNWKLAVAEYGKDYDYFFCSKCLAYARVESEAGEYTITKNKLVKEFENKEEVDDNVYRN